MIAVSKWQIFGCGQLARVWVLLRDTGITQKLSIHGWGFSLYKLADISVAVWYIYDLTMLELIFYQVHCFSDFEKDI